MNAMLHVLVDAALRGGLILALACAIALALRHRSAELRHAIWLVGLVGMLVLPLAAGLLPSWPVPILPGPTRMESLASFAWSPDVASAAGARARSTPAPRRPSREQVAFGLWGAGVLLFVLRGVGSHRRLAAVVRAAHPADDAPIARELALASSAVGIRLPTCLWSDHIDVPLAAGWRRPLLLLPAGARRWRREHLRSVLLHELSHLRRRDPLWLSVAQLTTALYWFHPLVWLAVRQLRAESERACDDAVLRAGERASGYADTLLAMALECTSPAPAAGVAFVRPSGLESRIGAILAVRLDRARLGRVQSWSVAAAGILLSLSLAVATPVPASGPVPTPPPDASRTPVARGESDGPRRAASTTVGVVGHRNEPDAPVLILEARARSLQGVEGNRVGITMPQLRLANRDDRRVRGLRLALDLPSTRDRIWVRVNISAGEEAFLVVPRRQWSSVVASWEARALEIQIVGVEFTDGSKWVAEGPLQPSPPPRPRKAEYDAPRAPTPVPPEIDRRLRARADTHGPTRPARFRNPAGARVMIVQALTPLTPVPAEGRSHTWLPRVRVENRAGQRVVALRIRYKADRESHAVSGFDVSIEPGGTVTLAKDTFPVSGRAEAMTVQLLGARFEDGSVWGTMDSSIDARDAWVYPLEGDGAR